MRRREGRTGGHDRLSLSSDPGDGEPHGTFLKARRRNSWAADPRTGGGERGEPASRDKGAVLTERVPAAGT